MNIVVLSISKNNYEININYYFKKKHIIGDYFLKKTVSF